MIFVNCSNQFLALNSKNDFQITFADSVSFSERSVLFLFTFIIGAHASMCVRSKSPNTIHKSCRWEKNMAVAVPWTSPIYNFAIFLPTESQILTFQIILQVQHIDVVALVSLSIRKNDDENAKIKLQIAWIRFFNGFSLKCGFFNVWSMFVCARTILKHRSFRRILWAVKRQMSLLRRIAVIGCCKWSQLHSRPHLTIASKRKFYRVFINVAPSERRRKLE